MSNNHTSNHSSVKTKRLIRQAFAELVQEKHSINNISVTELCRRADITRGTFYFHYDNLYDVANDFREEIFAAFFEQPLSFHRPEDINLYFDQITAYLKDNATTYKMLATAKDIPRFTKHLTLHLYQTLLRYLKQFHPHPSPRLNLDAEFFTDGAVCLLIKFFHNETPLSLDQINLYLQNMFHRMFPGI